MPQFVILRHEMPPGSAIHSHWDLMLATGEKLRTWSFTTWFTHGGSTPAEPKPDHRSSYLEYEGPVSNNRGVVHRVVSGTYVVVSQNEDDLLVRLVSAELQGELRCTDCGSTSILHWLAD